MMRLMSERWPSARCRDEQGCVVLHPVPSKPWSIGNLVWLTESHSARKTVHDTYSTGRRKQLSGTPPGSTAVATRCCKTQHLITV